jgi:hypothetical protein
MMTPEDKQEAEKIADAYEVGAKRWDALAENQYADAPIDFRMHLREMAAHDRLQARCIRFLIDEGTKGETIQ